ncbi:MAG: histidinol-phosphate transaminase, partial [Lachnospiraceae bacterium]|nr:histidinol-phosphate transaminase [Lachnospiraceae bacterium]
AAKCFQLHEEHVVLGNGAAELIKCLLEELHGTLGVIRPTFEEYANRWASECVVYDCTQDDFTYNAQQLITFFSEHPVDTLVLINPDNPSGYYMGQPEIAALLQWCKEENKNLIVDESFLDFADEENASLLSEKILGENPNLYVVKSISKSYGVPGLRLGILANGNADMIRCMKKSVSIWNINSMAEFFMQILDKYKADYENSLREIKTERKRLFEALRQIKSLKVYPSQANYFMCELLDGHTCEELVGRLLKRNILIKDLAGKIKNGRQYIRIAIRTGAENQRLVELLKEETQ